LKFGCVGDLWGLKGMWDSCDATPKAQQDGWLSRQLCWGAGRKIGAKFGNVRDPAGRTAQLEIAVQAAPVVRFEHALHHLRMTCRLGGGWRKGGGWRHGGGWWKSGWVVARRVHREAGSSSSRVAAAGMVEGGAFRTSIRQQGGSGVPTGGRWPWQGMRRVLRVVGL
jgi:hypothetical protein